MLESRLTTGPKTMVVELARIVTEIYSYVFGAQIQYCKLDAYHPFMEGTYTNYAIFQRTMKQFPNSLMMWKKLENLQKHLYGEDNMVLLYTYKNIGTCYLGTGQSDKAREYLQKSADLVASAKYDNDKGDVKTLDKEEQATLQQSLYLTYISDRNY
jgi:tetratricopeptide (TPR) repeat protein